MNAYSRYFLQLATMLTIIITAGGIGKRMGGEIPKQFLALQHKPILMHTVELFHGFDSTAELIVTLPENHLIQWEELCSKHHFTVPHRVVSGGNERFDSIKNALQVATGDYIAIHDGVRPFITQTVFETLVSEVKKYRAVIPVVEMKESLRLVDAERSVAVPRTNYRVVQTPQIFDGKLLQKAYEQPFQDSFTDDASVVESIGVKIHLVEGNVENIKITNPADLVLAEALLQSIN